MPIKFLVLGGGGILGFRGGGGGSADFIFMGAKIFLILGGGQKRGPKRAIFGHKKFSLCAFFLPLHMAEPHPALERQQKKKKEENGRLNEHQIDSEQTRGNAKALGVPKPGCFNPGCLQSLRGCALLRSFAPLCALLLRTRVCALLLGEGPPAEPRHEVFFPEISPVLLCRAKW